VAALAPADHRDVVSEAIIGRFRLSGGAADAVGTLFAHSGSSATGLFSGLLLFVSGVSLTRRMQRMYQQAWRLEARPGVGPAVHAALGLTALLLGISLLYLARALVGSLVASDVLLLTVSAVIAFLLWTAVPWLLLDRRIGWRRLVPTGALTAVCMSVYGIASTVYMPRLLETYSQRYGLFGVTLALVGWLLASAFIVVAATAVAAEFDRAPDPWARRLRGWGRIEPAAAEHSAPVADPPSGARPAATGGGPCLGGPGRRRQLAAAGEVGLRPGALSGRSSSAAHVTGRVGVDLLPVRMTCGHSQSPRARRRTRRGAHVARWSADSRVAAIAAELAPYAWRDFTDRMLARRVVGAADRYRVISFLTDQAGADLGPVDPVEPAEPGDERVDVLMWVLEDRHWRGLSLDRLCDDLVAALDFWEHERAEFDRGLRRLLEER
jgi:membrane protein